MNHHRICDPVDNGNSPSFQYKCPPDMEQIVKEFEEMAQPDESNTFYEDTDDSGDLQIEKQKLTRCQVKVRYVYALKCSYLMKIRDNLEKLSPLSIGQKPKLGGSRQKLRKSRINFQVRAQLGF